MSNLSVASSRNSASNDSAWSSLISRSIAAWNNIILVEQPVPIDLHKALLRQYRSLDDFLVESPKSVMFWFFQLRSAFMSQHRLKKWSRHELDDYVLLPAALGYVWRKDCFFVSHFWQSKDHPDPYGETLRRHQAELESQPWSYIWVDWTCMPQRQRSLPEEGYFHRCLGTMSGIIRNCGFMWFYPPFEPRLWILYEITEYVLTCEGGIPKEQDIELFLQHINEMFKVGVQVTLAKHDYRCSYDRDKEYLTSRLELLVLLKRHVNLDFMRRIMDDMTWLNVKNTQYYPGIELSRYEGTLVVNGKTHTFTPFRLWVSASPLYSTSYALTELTRRMENILRRLTSHPLSENKQTQKVPRNHSPDSQHHSLLFLSSR